MTFKPGDRVRSATSASTGTVTGINFSLLLPVRVRWDKRKRTADVHTSGLVKIEDIIEQ